MNNTNVRRGKRKEASLPGWELQNIQPSKVAPHLQRGGETYGRTGQKTATYLGMKPPNHTNHTNHTRNGGDYIPRLSRNVYPAPVQGVR